MKGVTRTLDLTTSTIGLILAVPILLIIFSMIASTMGRPVIFSQKRAGLGGRPFNYYKFRSMTEERDSEGNLLPDEDRLTRLGSFLRRTSLDELPSLFNVMRGDMSLVGPRPLYFHYVELYNPFQRRRLEVKPGLTGWAVVRGRNAISWEDKFELDVWYVDNRTVWLDLSILLKTVIVVLSRKGVAQQGKATVENFTGSPSTSTHSGGTHE